MRHTTLTWVERHFGYGVARAYAGHTDSTGPATTTYIKASLQEVATALAVMTPCPTPTTISLVVTEDEPARRVYLRRGFRVVDTTVTVLIPDRPG